MKTKNFVALIAAIALSFATAFAGPQNNTNKGQFADETVNQPYVFPSQQFNAIQNYYLPGDDSTSDYFRTMERLKRLPHGPWSANQTNTNPETLNNPNAAVLHPQRMR